jgi:hypothetical protein
MSKTMKTFGILAGLIASLFCLAGGLWILSKVGLDRDNDVVATGLGLYFIGKAFFVGPMLIVASLRKEPAS